MDGDANSRARWTSASGRDAGDEVMNDRQSSLISSDDVLLALAILYVMMYVIIKSRFQVEYEDSRGRYGPSGMQDQSSHMTTTVDDNR